MLWSVQSDGEVEEVRTALKHSFESMAGNCPEPEETIKEKSAQLINLVLDAQNPSKVTVSVSAWGSQTSYPFGAEIEPVSNSLNIVISVTNK